MLWDDVKAVVSVAHSKHIRGGLLTDQLESKHKKRTKQINSILKSTKTCKHRDTERYTKHALAHRAHWKAQSSSKSKPVPASSK